MHNDLRDHPHQEKSEETQGKFPIRPVMPVFHNLQSIALEVDLSVKIHLMERLHRDLDLAMIPRSILLVVKMQIVFHGTTRVSCFFVLPWRNGRGDVPKGTEDGNAGENCEEEGCTNSSPNFSCNEPGNDDDEDDKECIGEIFAAGGICRKRGILNGWILPHS